MQREIGIPNDNGFHLRQSWDNGAHIDSDFGPNSALFRKDGTLLSFDVQYNNTGQIASIALIPEKDWVEQGVSFFHNWLSPLGLKLLSDQVQFDPKHHNDAALYDSLAKLAIKKGGSYALHFLTKGIRDNNLMYVDIYTGTVYKKGTITIYPDIIFNKKSWF